MRADARKPIIARAAAVGEAVNEIDRSIGGRLRERRAAIGLTPEQLADRLSMDLENLLSYETGAKRISANQLLRIANALGVRPIYFFGSPGDRAPDTSRPGNELREAGASYVALPEQGLRLHRAFVNLRNDALRESIVALVVELAKAERAN